MPFFSSFLMAEAGLRLVCSIVFYIIPLINHLCNAFCTAPVILNILQGGRKIRFVSSPGLPHSQSQCFLNFPTFVSLPGSFGSFPEV